MVNEGDEDEPDLILLRIAKVIASHLVFIYEDDYADDLEAKVLQLR
jgi:hypothetical protein